MQYMLVFSPFVGDHSHVPTICLASMWCAPVACGI